MLSSDNDAEAIARMIDDWDRVLDSCELLKASYLLEESNSRERQSRTQDAIPAPLSSLDEVDDAWDQLQSTWDREGTP